jgi:undecaprenyl-diphosphatase
MDWNHQLFLSLNAPSAVRSPLTAVAGVVANSPVAVVPLVLAGLWVWGDPARRRGLLATAVGVLGGLAAAHLLGVLWVEPRPFMIGLGHTLMAHKVENSFPSDHATLLWSLSLGLLATRASRTWAAVTGLIGLATAWARIYLGVHFPIDMVGALGAAIAGGAVALWVGGPLAGWIYPSLHGAYLRLLDALRLPQRIAPR